VFENKEVEAVRAHVNHINSSNMSDFVSVRFNESDIFNLELHHNKYGIMDIDSNHLTTYGGCKDTYELINCYADDKCLVLIWNAIGMKGITLKEQRDFVDKIVVDNLKSQFNVSSNEVTYDDTALMYVRILKLQRR
jgi:hypothetical protein